MKISNKKKIIYCITKSNWGGAQKYVFDLATSINPDSYEIIVLAGGEGSLIARLQTKGIRTIVLNNLSRDISLWKDIFVFFKILKIFQKEKPDIVHLNSSKMGLLGALAGRVLRIPKTIFTGHGWAFNEDRSKWQRKTIYWLHQLTVILAHKTIAVSEQTRNQIIKKGQTNKKVVVIRNGIGEIDFITRELARGKISEKLPIDMNLDNRLWIGTISELHKNKGLKYLIEAIHLMDVASNKREDLPAVIIIGDGDRREKLQARINRYNLQDVIFMVGRVPEAEKYLKAFDIFTLTSTTEALPYVLLEAGQASLPIIASAVGGIPAIITDQADGILVRPREPEEIRKAIDFLINNPEKRSLFGENIQSKIKTKFTKQEMVAKTLNIYNQI